MFGRQVVFKASPLGHDGIRIRRGEPATGAKIRRKKKRQQEGAREIGGMAGDPGKPKRFVEEREREHLSQPTEINPKEAESGGLFGLPAAGGFWVVGGGEEGEGRKRGHVHDSFHGGATTIAT